MKTKDLEKKFLSLDKELADLRKHNDERRDQVEGLSKLVDELRKDVVDLKDLMEIKDEEIKALKSVMTQLVADSESTKREANANGKEKTDTILISENKGKNDDLPTSPYPDEVQRKAYLKLGSKLDLKDAWSFRSGKHNNIEGDFSMQKVVDTTKLIAIGTRSKSASSPQPVNMDEHACERGSIDEKWEAKQVLPRSSSFGGEEDDLFVLNKNSGSSEEGGPSFPRAGSSMSETNVEFVLSRTNSLASDDDIPASLFLSSSPSYDHINGTGVDVDAIVLQERGKTVAPLSEEGLRRFTSNVKLVITAQKLARGFLARKHTRQLKRRTEAVKELVQTEIGYVSSLDALIKYYLKPLRKNSTSPDSFILPSYLDEIFSTVEDMRQNNGEILTELVGRLSTWNYFTNIADVFLTRMDLLSAHLPYVVNYERAQEVVKACKKIPEFVAFVNEKMKLAELEYKALDDFLILPVQRIPRYIMLLESILKYLPPNHPDKDNTKAAVAKMRAFAYKINKRKEARVRLMEMARKMSGLPQDENLLEESRYLVRDGFLYNEKKRPKFCLLLNDALIVTKSSIKPSVKVTVEEAKKRKLTYEYTIPLTANTKLLVSLAGDTGTSTVNPVTMTLMNHHVKYLFITPSNDEGTNWIKDIHANLDHFRKKTGTLRNVGAK